MHARVQEIDSAVVDITRELVALKRQCSDMWHKQRRPLHMQNVVGDESSSVSLEQPQSSGSGPSGTLFRSAASSFNSPQSLRIDNNPSFHTSDDEERSDGEPVLKNPRCSFGSVSPAASAVKSHHSGRDSTRRWSAAHLAVDANMQDTDQPQAFASHSARLLARHGSHFYSDGDINTRTATVRARQRSSADLHSRSSAAPVAIAAATSSTSLSASLTTVAADVSSVAARLSASSSMVSDLPSLPSYTAGAAGSGHNAALADTVGTAVLSPSPSAAVPQASNNHSFPEMPQGDVTFPSWSVSDLPTISSLTFPSNATETGSLLLSAAPASGFPVDWTQTSRAYLNALFAAGHPLVCA